MVLHPRRPGVTLLLVVSALAVSLIGLVSVPASADQNESARFRVAAASVTSGFDHTCALLVTGAVRCWGGNDLGQLGLGNNDALGDNEAITTAPSVPLGAPATAVSAGGHHTCALLVGGAVRCWGDNSEGQLGLGTTADLGDNEAITSTPAVPLGAQAIAISAGELHTCALLVTGAVRCWGYNGNGQLGLGNTNTVGDNEGVTSVPAVPLGAPAIAIAAGDTNTCAILVGGALRCWGYNVNGELGLGNTAKLGDDEAITSAPPVPLGGSASAVSVGNHHICALLTSGSVRCWGSNIAGQLGLGNTDVVGDNETAGAVPVVPLGAPAIGISAGGVHTCALLASGSVRCWGRSTDGELGLGNTSSVGDDEAITSVSPVPLGASVVAVTTGASRSCAVFASGALRCWGDNFAGGLGLGTTNDLGDDEAVTSAPVVPSGQAVRVRAVTTHDLKAKKKRDRTRPYKFRLRGTVAGAFVSDAATCTGTVKVRVKKPATRTHKVRKIRYTSLRAGATGCTWRLKVKVPVAGRYRVVATLPTTDNLIGSRDRIRVRAG